LPCFTMFFIC